MIYHRQSALLKYPDDTVPELVPVDVVHVQPPEQVRAPAQPDAAAHGPPAGPVYPVVQVQASSATLALGELELAGQPVHAAVPVATLYVPVPHAAHGPPFGPVYPEAQGVDAPKQLDDPTAEVVPAGHAVHAWSPATFLYVLMGHCRHGPGLVVHRLLHPQHCKHAPSETHQPLLL